MVNYMKSTWLTFLPWRFPHVKAKLLTPREVKILHPSMLFLKEGEVLIEKYTQQPPHRCPFLNKSHWNVGQILARTRENMKTKFMKKLVKWLISCWGYRYPIYYPHGRQWKFYMGQTLRLIIYPSIFGKLPLTHPCQVHPQLVCP